MTGTGRVPRILRALALATTVGLIVGCRPQAAPPTPPLQESAERGPLKYTLSATPPQVWIADPVTVSLEVRTPAEYGVQFPDARAFEPIKPRSAGEPLSTTQPDGTVLWTKSFILEPMTSGEFEIPPLPVRYGKRAAAGQPEVYEDELVTSGLKVNVRSALTSQDSMLAPRDITGIRAAPVEPWPTWVWACILLGALLAAGAIYWSVRAWRRRVKLRARPLVPEVWALKALDGLSGRVWGPNWGAREHYYRMTEVVRKYIELKFKLRAPEMTTEEFLRTLSRNASALPYDASRLRAFLESCDLVKYAAYEPARDDGDDAIRTARAFIHSTATAADELALRQSAAQRTAAAARADLGDLAPRGGNQATDRSRESANADGPRNDATRDGGRAA